MTPFLQENSQLGSALHNLIDFYSFDGKSLLKLLREIAGKRNRVLFLGMGTSEFTPQLIKWHLEKTGIHAETADAGEWYYYGSGEKSESGLSVLTSQSGESIEIINLVDKIKQSTPFIAITNNPESTLGTAARLTLPLCAGEERTITTKTFTNTMALLYLIAQALDPAGSVHTALDELKASADLLSASDYSDVEKAAASLGPAETLTFVARGPAVVSAKQCALTFMEGAKNVSVPFTGGAFNHGPFESVDETFCLVAFRPDGPTALLMEKCAEKASSRGGKVVLFTDRDFDQVPNILPVAVPRIEGENSEILFPLLAAAKQNFLLHLIAESRGIEAGVFRYGSKITGRE